MNKLFMDTSTQTLVLILAKDEQIVDYTIQLTKNDQSERLMPMIEELLTKHQMTPKELDAIYVGYGPGSYTGVRIGVTVSKMLSYTLGKPLYYCSSLEVMAASYINHATYIVPVIDARRGNVFSGVYQVHNGQLKVILEEKLYDFNDLYKQINDLHLENVLLVGLDSEKFDVPKDKRKADYLQAFNPDLVMNQIEFKEVSDVHQFVPNYKRISEAERNLINNE